MATQTIFQVQLFFGYFVWALCVFTYVVPWLKSLSAENAQRAIATLHSFRFFGLAFLVPGFVGSGLPAQFAVPTAYGDFATAMLAIMALLTFRIRPAFWFFVVAFNVVGAIDLVMATVHAVQMHLPELAGQLGTAYVIPVLYVPLLMLTHIVAFSLMLQRRPVAAAA